jgi:hypothetical protein
MQSTLAHRLIMTGLISLMLVGLWPNVARPLVRAEPIGPDQPSRITEEPLCDDLD